MKDKRWMSARVRCRKCDHEWAAVAPVVVEYLECPECHHMTPAPAVPLPGEEDELPG